MKMRGRLLIWTTLSCLFLIISIVNSDYTSGKNEDGPVWITEDGDFQRTGCSPYSCSDNPGRVIWTYGPITMSSRPAIDEDGMIYIGDQTSRFHAIYPNGQFKWVIDLGSDADVTPVIDHLGRIIVGTDDGHLLCLDKQGREIWSFEANGTFDSSAVVSDDGSIYACVEEGYNYIEGERVEWGERRLYALDQDGTESWSYGDNLKWDSAPTLGTDGTIYLNTDEILAFYPNGTIRWTYSYKGYDPLDPVVVRDNGDILYPVGVGIVCLSPNGIFKWIAEGHLGYDIFPTEGGDIYVISDTAFYIIDENGNKKDKKNDIGSILDIPDPIMDSDENIIYDSTFSLKMFDRNGTKIWEHVPEGYFISGKYYGFVNEFPVIAQDGIILYYCRPTAELVALGRSPPAKVKNAEGKLEDGEVILTWSYTITGSDDPSMYQNIDGFRIYRMEDQGDPELIAELSQYAINYHDEDAPYGDLEYRIVAYDGEYEGQASKIEIENDFKDVAVRWILIIGAIAVGSVVILLVTIAVILTFVNRRKAKSERLSSDFFKGGRED